MLTQLKFTTGVGFLFPALNRLCCATVIRQWEGGSDGYVTNKHHEISARINTTALLNREAPQTMFRY